MKQAALLSILIISVALHAQDSLHLLQPVVVSSVRAGELGTGLKKENYDSLLLQRNSYADLGGLLASQSLVFVKNYGPGTLASTSLRGAGAAHTAILWNGFNLQSPMNANMDLSLIPVFFFDDISVEYGSGSALWGSGAVGGTILLASPQLYGKGFVAGAGYLAGSYGEQQEQVRLGFSGKKAICSMKFFDHSATNDYGYFNLAKAGRPLDHQQHASISSHGFTQDNDFSLNSRNTITTRFWYQDTEREIPPSMTESVSLSTQHDRSARVSAAWSRHGERLTLDTRAALLHDFLGFKDDLIGINSMAISDSYIAEAEGHFPFRKNSMINLGINNTFAKAHSADYSRDPSDDRFAIFGSWQIHDPSNRIKATLSMRQEFMRQHSIPFTPSIGWEGRILRYFTFTGNLSRHYRLPTFNDLYYQGAGGRGNPDLKPEDGWNADAGLHLHAGTEHLKIYASCSVFDRTIKNWILWQPVASFTWTPGNVQAVWSRGIEYELSTSVHFKKWMAGISARYNYILSTVEQTPDPTDAGLHKQLPYVPVQNAQGDLTAGWSGFRVSLTQTYTGYRYTTSDNLQYLNPYSLTNIDVSWSKQLVGVNLRIFARFNNIFNINYQVYEYRAMPLNNGQCGVSIVFTQPQKIKK